MQREVEALGGGFAPRDLLRLAVEAQNVADEDNATRDASHARRSRDPPLDRTLGITAKGSGHVDVALGPQALAAAPSAESSARQASSLDESVDGKGVAHRVGACTLVFLGLHPVAAVVAETLARAGAREFVVVDVAPVSAANVGVGGLYRAADVGASRSAVLATRLTGLTGGRARVHTVHAHASSLLSDYRTLLGRRVAPAAPARQPWGPLPRLEALLRALGRPSLQENRARARAVPPVRDSGAEAPPASRVAARTELWSKAATPAAVRRPKPGVIFVHCAEAPGAGDEASLDRSLVTAGRLARELDATMFGVRWPLRDASKPNLAAAVVTVHVPRVTACPECPPLGSWVARGTHLRLRRRAVMHRGAEQAEDAPHSGLRHAASAVARLSATARRTGAASAGALDPSLTAGAAQAVGATTAHCVLAWVAGSASAAGAVAVGLRDLVLRPDAGAPRTRWTLAHWSTSSFHGPSWRCRAPDCEAPLENSGGGDGREEAPKGLGGDGIRVCP